MGEHEKILRIIIRGCIKGIPRFFRKDKTVSRSGFAAEEIMKEAEKGNHDFIVMGHGGVGAFSRAMLESVENKVLNHSHKKVLIIQ